MIQLTPATWQVRLNPAKCEALNLSNKRSPLQFTYTIGGGPILWKSLVRYLGVYINSKLTGPPRGGGQLGHFALGPTLLMGPKKINIL